MRYQMLSSEPLLLTVRERWESVYRTYRDDMWIGTGERRRTIGEIRAGLAVEPLTRESVLAVLNPGWLAYSCTSCNKDSDRVVEVLAEWGSLSPPVMFCLPCLQEICRVLRSP